MYPIPRNGGMGSTLYQKQVVLLAVVLCFFRNVSEGFIPHNSTDTWRTQKMNAVFTMDNSESEVGHINLKQKDIVAQQNSSRQYANNAFELAFATGDDNDVGLGAQRVKRSRRKSKDSRRNKEPRRPREMPVMKHLTGHGSATHVKTKDPKLPPLSGSRKDKRRNRPKSTKTNTRCREKNCRSKNPTKDCKTYKNCTTTSPLNCGRSNRCHDTRHSNPSKADCKLHKDCPLIGKRYETSAAARNVQRRRREQIKLSKSRDNLTVPDNTTKLSTTSNFDCKQRGVCGNFGTPNVTTVTAINTDRTLRVNVTHNTLARNAYFSDKTTELSRTTMADCQQGKGCRTFGSSKVTKSTTKNIQRRLRLKSKRSTKGRRTYSTGETTQASKATYNINNVTDETSSNSPTPSASPKPCTGGKCTETASFVTSPACKKVGGCETRAESRTSTWPIMQNGTTSNKDTQSAGTAPVKKSLKDPSKPVNILDGKYCEAVKKRGIDWPRTLAGTTAAVPCPTNISGTASWHCNKNAKWHRNTPDLRDCIHYWAIDIGYEMNNQSQPALHILNNTYGHVTRDVSEMYGGDILGVSHYIHGLITLHNKQLIGLPLSEQVAATKAFSELILDVADQMLLPLTTEAWFDIPSGSARRQPAVRMMEGVEEGAFLLSESLAGKSVFHEKQTYAMEIRSMHETLRQDMTFPSRSLYDTYGASVQLPSGYQNDVGGNSGDGVNAVFIVYSTLYGMLAEDCDEEDTNRTRYLGSKVISASLQSLNTSVKFQEGRQVQLVFKKQYTNDNAPGDTSCVFWKDGPRSGDPDDLFWLTEGCSLVSSNITHAVCACDHLTNFAILLDLTGAAQQVSKTDEIVLNVITYVGCSISIVCLSVCVFTFSFFKKLWCVRNTIHRNLCLCLLLGELVFLVGADKTSEVVACKVVAVALHYIFLCAFSWMCLEGVQMYLMLVRVFNSRCSIIWYYLFGYGLPTVILGLCAGFLIDGYGTPYSCWLKIEDYTILAFAVPVGLVLIINMAILCLSMRVVVIQTRKKAEETRSSEIGLIRSWIKGSFVLLSLLGTTWTLGFLYINNDTVVFAYIFTVLNTSQGLFIFIFHCCISDSVRSQFKMMLIRSRCCPLSVKDKLNKSYSSSMYNGAPQRRGHSDSSKARTRSLQFADFECSESPSQQSGKPGRSLSQSRF